MQLNPDSWFVKYWLRWGMTEYNYNIMIGKYWDSPSGADICTLGRVALIYAPLKTLVIAVPLIWLITMAVLNPMGALAIFALILGTGVVFGILGVIVWYSGKGFSNGAQHLAASPVGQYYKAWKENYCLKVTFGGTSSNSTSLNTSE